MLQLRHYVRDVYQDVGLRAVLRRLFVVSLAPFRSYTFLKGKHNKIGQHTVWGVYTSTNHLKAIRAHSDYSDKEYLQIMIGGESVHPSSNLLDSMVSISLLKRHLWLLLCLLSKMFFLRGNTVRKLALICEYITYRSTLAMLEELKTRPEKVIIADSFSPRMIAVIDFYRSISVDTEMIQHGLIQAPSRYRSHADIYSFWSEFEYVKVKHYLSSSTLVRFVGPKLTRPAKNCDQSIQDCLIVLNPYQGIGREYSKKLIDYLLSLAEIRSIYVRLHPSDDRDMFIRQMKNMKNVHLSQRTWAEDLGQYTHFALLNSTCVLDVLNADKNVATLMCNKLGYSKPAIANPELIPDLDTPQDFVRFVTDICKQSIKEKIMNETFLEFANSCQ